MTTISAPLPTGLTVTLSLLLGTTVAASGIAMPEALPGFYSATVPTNLAAGDYTALVYSVGTIVATGQLRWSGTDELGIAADIHAVNGYIVKGSGVFGDTWGPV